MSLWQCSNCFQVYSFEEYLKLESKWINENDKNQGKTLVCKCGNSFLKDNWELKTKDSSGHVILTKHLELGHQSNMTTNKEEIMWYETSIMRPGGDFLSFQARYTDKTEAIQGHELTVRLLPKIIENPERYPSNMVAQLLDKIKKDGKQRIL